jgi:site-specific DNA-methyltransferase (adenine-specific)
MTCAAQPPSPYWSSPDGRVVLYRGDCRDVLPMIAPESVALLLTDPPYGVSERTDRKAKGRSNAADCNDFPAVYGDNEPFDPAHLLRFPRVVLFGANHYATRLPTSATWLVWDKLDGLATDKRSLGFNDNADCELAWTNLGGPARLVAHRWTGMIKASEKDDRRLHPTQKPVILMQRIIAEYTKPDDLIVDPYAGSGSTIVAARNLGRRVIGVEYESAYCDVIVQRMAQGLLFGGAT